MSKVTRKIPPLVEEIIAVSHQICKKESNIEIVRDSVTGTFVSLALVQLPVQPYIGSLNLTLQESRVVIFS